MKKAFNRFRCFLLVGASVVQSLSQLILTRNAVRGDEEAAQAAPLLKIVVLVSVVIGVAATIAAAITIMGVRL